MKEFFDNSHIVEIATTLLIAGVLYFIGSKLIQFVVGAVARHNSTEEDISTAHKQGLEKRYKTLRALFLNIWRLVVIVMTFFAIARLFFTYEQLAPLFASAGILGVALGFGAQSLVKDFLSGLFIISENQYRVGDVIEIDGFSGTVERIGTRSTVLRDIEGNVHFFPNGIVQHVINKTMDYSKARVVVSVSPDTNIDEAARIIDKIGHGMIKEDEWKDRIIEAPQFVMMGGLSATAVELIISGKVQPSSQWSVASEMRRRILEEFEEHGVEFAVSSDAATVLASKPEPKRGRRGKK